MTVEAVATHIMDHVSGGGAFSVGTLRNLFTSAEKDTFWAALNRLETSKQLYRFYDRAGVILYKAVKK